MTTAAHAAATKAARGKRPPPNSRRRSRCSRPRPGGSPNSCHAWTNASRGWPPPRTGSAGRWRRSSTASATPTACPTRSPPRDHHRQAEAPEHQRGGDTRRRHRPGTDPEPRRHTMDRPGPARRVPRCAADLMEKRARPRSKRPRPRSGRGVRCTRHPCRQASLRVSPRRGAGRPHPPAMGALSVIQWCAAPGPVACRRLGPVLWPHVRAAKAIRAVFG